MKKVLVVGMGSMGKRRARLLKQIDPNTVVCGVDANPQRAEESLDREFDFSYVDLETGIREFQPDAAIVSTSPASHHRIIPTLLQHGLHVFTELNLISDGYEELMALAAEKNRTLFLSSTFLYRKDVQYIQQAVVGKKVNYHYHSGQFLPDWHPWESYKNFFVSDAATNGCREIFAIDMPWILSVMGPVKEVSVLCGNLTDLEVRYPDNYLLQVVHENGTKGTIAVDIVSRKAVRSLEVYSQELYLKWEGNPNELYSCNLETKAMEQIKTYDEVERNKGYRNNENIIENAYEEELRTFFGVIEGTAIPLYTFADDKKTLALIDQIEAQARTV